MWCVYWLLLWVCWQSYHFFLRTTLYLLIQVTLPGEDVSIAWLLDRSCISYKSVVVHSLNIVFREKTTPKYTNFFFNLVAGIELHILSSEHNITKVERHDLVHPSHFNQMICLLLMSSSYRKFRNSVETFSRGDAMCEIVHVSLL